MSNKIETVSIGDLPIATELDDADELLLRDVSATLPENATARLSIATLRAAMGGAPDRIESASGAAFSEATDSFRGLGTPASQSEAIARGAGASSGAYTLPKGADKAVAEAALFAGTAAMTNGASIKARYDSETGERRLVAEGAPLEVPTPTAPNHAATKGYVDARPGAEEWSEHAATQDVDLDGHKLTGLGEPTEEDDAATKGYVDSVSPAKIERTFYWGSAVAEVTDDGNVDLSVYLTGETAPLRRVRVFRGSAGGAISLMNRSLTSDRVSTLSIGTTSPSLTYAVTDGPAGSAFHRGGLRFDAGRWYFAERNGSDIPLGSEGYYALPSGVSSIKHGIHLAKEAYDTLAEMPAPPDLEWWEPVWTLVENVDSVSNVECQYTRTYRAAGGSLVTLEGTIEVTPEAADVMTMVSVDLPVPRIGVEGVGGTGSFTDYDGDDFGLALAGVADLGAGQQVAVRYTPSTNAVHRVSFRISYRAA